MITACSSDGITQAITSQAAIQLLSKLIYSVKIIIYGGTVICSKHITQLNVLQNNGLVEQIFSQIYLMFKIMDLHGTFHFS